ncbi:MAG: NAD-dependent deacetylase [Spirochaetota bacterium]|nr:NAD-dependent deacetylase [Spirochaetota bacterium]
MIYNETAKLIQKADAILICAGAGMGVDSGLPDFRGNQGFWRAYPPYAEKGLSFVDMANPDWFYRDPEFAWGFYGHRLNLYRNTTPHYGFNILLKWAQKMKMGYFVFTSNVDGQFQKAGFSDERIIEVHGSIHHLQCLDNCGKPIFNSNHYNIEINDATMRANKPLPSCPNCDSLARPNILMFGDWGWDSSREEMQRIRYANWLSGLDNSNLIIIECGAGTSVPTVRYETEKIANHFNATAIRINTRQAQIPLPNLSIANGALETLSQIDKILN